MFPFSFLCNRENFYNFKRRHITNKIFLNVLCFVDRASRYNCVKKNQLDAQIIFSILRQPLRVSGVSSPIIRRYNRMYTTTGTYFSC